MLDNVGGGGVRKKGVRRSAADRAAIIAESYEPGATVASVARRQSNPTKRSKLWTNPVVWRSGMPNRTFNVRQA